MNWRFNPTVDLGQILVIVTFLFTIFAGYTRIMSRIAIIESRVSDLWKAFMNGKVRDLS